MRTRAPARLVALGAAVACLLAAACTSAVVDERASDGFFDAAPDTSVAPSPEPDRLRHAPVPAPAPVLPVPEPLPLDPYAPTPDVVLGRISIPAIGLDEGLQVGMTLTAIDRGPSHWPGTALPGQLGNMVVAGHRTTYSRPFLDLDLIQPGDEMVVETTDGARHVYRATHTEVVPEDALWIADQTHAHTATTFACHPKGSTRERIVVRWALVDTAGESDISPT